MLGIAKLQKLEKWEMRNDPSFARCLSFIPYFSTFQHNKFETRKFLDCVEL
jgi:hypothetical protein